MANRPKMKCAVSFLALLAISLGSCKKNNLTDTTSGTSSSGTTSTIAVAARLTNTSSSSTDSLFLLHHCNSGLQRVQIAESALPSAISTYLTANYSGYTFSKAFAVADTSGTTVSYVVVIYYNNKPVGLEFDALGNFVRVLEQRERGDCDGPGHGGRFHDRDGRHGDTIALANLPTSVLSYMSTNYASDTLVQAFRGCDSSIVVISQNGAVYATTFDASGNFVSRVQAQIHGGHGIAILQSQLPAAVQSYISATYPNAVFERAFKIMAGSNVQGYVVIIDASGTKYALEFDSSGNFVHARVIH